ncbi:disulfide bond formation protein B [Candidatus Pelagibacter sp.]|nr:disulfide bond formation protein B [Candidatus Pelagibacter sp.]
MVNITNKTYLTILFLVSLVVLMAAYTIQYLLGYQPCKLCLIERIPYVLSLIILILNYRFKKNEIFFSVLLSLIFIFSSLISIYHFGIEQGFISESNVCGYDDKGSLITKEAVLRSLKEITVNCKDVAFRVFGLSLSTYNIIISLIMFLISAKVYLINNENKK